MDLFSVAALSNRFAGVQWTGITSRSAALPQLPVYTLLHAGPPIAGQVPHAIANSACVALVYEGLASDVIQAQALLRSGQVSLVPAQDHGVVTPLAQVVSASMPLAQLQSTTATRYAPLIEAGVPALRFGNPSPDALARLRLMDGFAHTTLQTTLRTAPVGMAAMVHAGLSAQEDCHTLTTAANLALVEALALPLQDQLLLKSYPAFVLPIVMAACSVWLQDSGGEITAAAGNGLQFGYKRRGEVDWHTVPATAPRGQWFNMASPADALGAIGDSAVVDFAGLGGQALAFCPSLCEAYAAYLPNDAKTHRQAVLDGATGNISIAAVQASGQAPLVNLAIVGAAETAGLIGRGVYQVPMEALNIC